MVNIIQPSNTRAITIIAERKRMNRQLLQIVQVIKSRHHVSQSLRSLVQKLAQQLVQPLNLHQRVRRLTTVTLLISSMSALAGNFTAEVDRDHISAEETFNLTLQYDEQINANAPDTEPLNADFDIISRNQSSQFRSINGQVEAFTRWNLMLAPKHAGRLITPALTFAGESSQPITITVSAVGSGQPVTTTSTERPVYLETSLNKDRVFVQEQLLLTVRLVTAVNLSGISADDMNIDNALVKQIAETKFQKRINGKPHLIVETTYAVFPQQSGNLTIPALTWTVGMDDSNSDPFFGRRGKQLRLKTEAKIIPVLPQPSNYPTTTWLPAANLNLTQQWSQPTDRFTVGEPITRTITLSATGLNGAQLPPLNIQPNNKLKYYPDQPQTSDTINSQGITGIRTESYAIVPTTPGKQLLPAVVINWWDTTSGRLREASLPAQEINVSAD